MKNSLFLTVHSVIYALFAILLFAIPDQLWPMYGLQVNDEYARFLSQHNSIFLGGIAIISFLFRDVHESTTQKKILQGLLGTNLLGVAITLYACVNHIFVGFGWSDPIFFAVLAALCVYQLKAAK